MDDLLPCPFCGSTRLNYVDARDFISCLDCGTEGPCALGQGSGASIDAWNTRAFGQGKNVSSVSLTLIRLITPDIDAKTE